MGAYPLHFLSNSNPSKEILQKTPGYYLNLGWMPNIFIPYIPQGLLAGHISTTTLNPNLPTITLPSGAFSSLSQAMMSGAIPESLSSAKWSDSAQGFPQQTFLGASIRSFSMQGGFGDTSSSLTVDLVVDEYNVSDRTPAGQGDDIYHSGGVVSRPGPVGSMPWGDYFAPPIPGSPVFFKFGPNFATIEEAFAKTFDDLYGYNTVKQIQPQSAGSYSMNTILNGTIPNAGSFIYVDTETQSTPLLENASRPGISYAAIRNQPNIRGKDHIVFGGILQTYTQSRTFNGNPLYSVNVIDPREILSNVTLILNNYSGPTYEQKNILNLYGFLEYSPTEPTINEIKRSASFANTLKREIEISGPNIGKVKFTGDDKYYRQNPVALTAIKANIDILETQIAASKRKIAQLTSTNNIPGAIAEYNNLITISTNLAAEKIKLTNAKNQTIPKFPMTGTGFSRRSDQGIPFYRVQDAIEALMEYYMKLPKEYADQGFGGRINFRGFNYVVDFGGLPSLPEFYYLDFDQMNLLELAQEICDVTNRDLFVSLLPVTNHPACASIKSYNSTAPASGIVAGIIRIDTIDRSQQPVYGAVKRYIDDLALNNIYVENQDLGYELSNVTTDKFIVGAQEIDMHYFSSNADRDTLSYRKTGQNITIVNKPLGHQWTLDCSLEQQILPYYGKLGNNAVTIPKGFGAYQQILLDATNLNAAGVGAYYVATEMELRCALISFDRWKEFLKLYNDVYLDSLESDDPQDKALAGLTPAPLGGLPPAINVSTNYSVCVPRSVFDTYAMPEKGRLYDDNGLPLSACNPPYGYPLYYKRMTQIGIPEAGLTDLFTRWRVLTTNLAELRSSDSTNLAALLNSQFQRLKQAKESQGLTAFEQTYYNTLETLLSTTPNPTDIAKILTTIATLENDLKSNSKNVFAMLPRIARKNNENAMKVYNFVKSVAEECLGKKFLVKIPKKVNLFYDTKITTNDPTILEYTRGPFGFRPRSTRNIAGYEFTPQFKGEVIAAGRPAPPATNMMQSFLNSGLMPLAKNFAGALNINYNPIADKYEANYTPMNIGGYFPFDLYQNTLGSSAAKDISKVNFYALPSGIIQGLIPQDLTNFINEDGRVSPYVRFDNAQDLTLEGLNNADFTQQFIFGNSMIPDLTEALDNTGADTFNAFTNRVEEPADKVKKPAQVAFVKCTVDDQLYMPPKIISRSVAVHGQQVKDIGTRSMPNKIFIPCSGISGNKFVDGSGVWVDSFSFYKANYVPDPTKAPGQATITDFASYNPFIDMPGGQLINNSFYIQTDIGTLDTEHVYALITLPNRIIPSKDARFRDGPFQTVNAERFKHLMTSDVVRGLAGFSQPGYISRPPIGNLISPNALKSSPTDNRIKAWLAMKKAHAGLSFGFPQQINVTMPSPVYPDLVALPLMSHDRCYGPWVSSQLDGQAYILKNIGGRVDFIKDENLSPWNYGGYQLMNEAGRLQAEFSNSLLLFSERGAFTVPSIPKGNSLCQELILGGPLVTSINVDVSTGGARTTYQMDLYTASFGKLQRQKQAEISKISRERKKLNSERNALIRKGLGKNQSARNFNQELKTMRAGAMPGLNEMNLGMANALTKIGCSINKQSIDQWSSSINGGITTNSYQSYASTQDESMQGRILQLHPDQNTAAFDYYNSAVISQSDQITVASHGHHGVVSYRPNSTKPAHNSIFFTANTDEVTKLGDDTIGDRI